jgi:hypothetical protein
MRVPEDVRKCVVYLGRLIHKGSVEEFNLAGTGFLVGVPSVRRLDRMHRYLVTAKHVSDGFFDGPFGIRINMKNGGATWVQVGGEKVVWAKHPTQPESVDASAISLNELSGEVDCRSIHVSMFLDDKTIESRDIGPGDEVFVVGIFSKMIGRTRNTPIVRIGNVAAIPDSGELIPDIKIGAYRGDIEGYLVEMRSLGGLSGSPAFLRETLNLTTVFDLKDPNRKVSLTGAGSIYFMGLMHGHWYIKDRDKNDVITLAVEKDHPEANIVGISVVVPAKKILEILNQPAFVEERKRGDDALDAAAGTTSTE